MPFLRGIATARLHIFEVLSSSALTVFSAAFKHLFKGLVKTGSILRL